MNYTLLHKTFSSSLFKYTSALEKYVLSSTLYAKYYIKVVDTTEIYDKQIKLYTLDNTFNILNIAFNRRKKKLKRFNLEVGSSLALNFFKFRNRFSEHWSFKSLLSTRKARTIFGTKRFFMFLKSKKLKKFYSFFFLRPIKGGFLVYSKGAVCFLPKSHFKYALKYFLKSMQLEKMHKTMSILSKGLYKINHRFLIPIRLPYAILQMSFWRMGRIRYNFGLSRKKKRRRQYSKFRLVILYNKKREWVKKKKKKNSETAVTAVTAAIFKDTVISVEPRFGDMSPNDLLLSDVQHARLCDIIWRGDAVSELCRIPGSSPLEMLEKVLSKPLTSEFKKSWHLDEKNFKLLVKIFASQLKHFSLKSSLGLNPKYNMIFRLLKEFGEELDAFLKFVVAQWIAGLRYKSTSVRKHAQIIVYVSILIFNSEGVRAYFEELKSFLNESQQKLLDLLFFAIKLKIMSVALLFPGEPDVPYLDKELKIKMDVTSYYQSIKKRYKGKSNLIEKLMK